MYSTVSFTKLEHLSMSGNGMTVLPPCIDDLKESIQYLDISGNNFPTSLPLNNFPLCDPCLFLLFPKNYSSAFRRIYTHNSLSDIPSSLSNLVNLYFVFEK